MRKRIKLISLSYLLAFASFVILCMRVGYPAHRAIGITLYLVSFGIFIYALRDKKHWVTKSKEKLSTLLSGRLSQIVYTSLAAIFIYLLWVLVPMERSPLLDLEDSALHTEIKNDFDTLILLNDNMVSSFEHISQTALFDQALESLEPEQKQEIKRIWSDFLQAVYELDIFKEKYKGFMQISYQEKPELHAKAFCIAYGAYVAQYRANLYLNKLVNRNAFIETLLNEADGTHSIPHNAFYTLQQRTTHPHTLLRFNAGKAYLKLAKKHVKGYSEAFKTLSEAIEHIDKALINQPYAFIDNPLDFFEKKAFKAWLPIQMKVALGMSHIRLTERDHFITTEIINQHRDKFEPGDIFLERRNWYATNIGIPGYWPHAALYIGSLQEMDAFFAGLPRLKGRLASEVIQERYPELFERLQQVNDAGEVKVIIEAAAPGVIFNSLEKSAHADSLAVLRPRINKSDTFKAVLQALEHHGKPYDYNFDFATDNSLVCSELVFKAYEGIDEISLKTIKINGRSLLPPNLIAKKFADELKTDEPQLELVLFLDGSEKKQTVIEKDHTAFVKSWQRPKWYIFNN